MAENALWHSNDYFGREDDNVKGVLIGIFAGIVSGMGIGGGMVLIPALVFFLGAEQHLAQCVNLYYFIPTAAASLFVHVKNKNVKYKKIGFIILSGIPFSLLGAYLALMTKGEILGKIFGGFLLALGIKEAYCGFTNKK